MAEIKTYLMKNNTTLDIFSIYDKIDTSPEYQRQGELWNLEKRQLFIDSILSGYDIPKLYLHILKHPKKQGKIHAIIDGKQRLETLWLFMNNEFRIGDYNIPIGKKLDNLKGLEYRDLARGYLSLRSRFDSYKLPIVCVETEDDEIDLIEEMFSRLNQAVSLTSAEFRNAMGGNMVKLIRKTASHDFFKHKVSFSNKRYQHYEVSIRLLFLENCILEKKLKDTKKKFLDTFTKKYKTEKPNSQIYNNVKEVLDTMSKIFQIQDDLLTAQGRIPIYYLLIRQAKKQRKLNKVNREKIEAFHEAVMKHKKLALDPANYKKARPELVEYNRLTIQGTNDATSIQSRLKIISKRFGIDNSEFTNLTTSSK